jgi:hypothetical protein
VVTERRADKAVWIAFGETPHRRMADS